MVQPASWDKRGNISVKEKNVKNIEGYCSKETHELQALLSPSEDSKECDWLRWQVERHIQKQEPASRHSRTHLDTIGDCQTQSAESYITNTHPQAKGNLNYLFLKKIDLGCTRAFSEQPQKNSDILANEMKSIAFREDFLTHCKNIQTVSFAIEAKNTHKWIDAEKYLPQEQTFGKALQEKIQAVHNSLEGLAHLFSGKGNQAHVSREEEVASFASKEFSTLEKMKQAMEGMSKTKRGSGGQKALETMKQCYQDTEERLSVVLTERDHPHTLGALENSLKDVSRKLSTLALGEAEKLHLEVKNNHWDRSTIANIVEDQSYADYAQQCFQQLDIQLGRCIRLVKGKEPLPAVRRSLTSSDQRNAQERHKAILSDDRSKQHDQEAAEQLLTALKDLTDSYDQAMTVKQVIELAQARKNFKDTRDPQPVRKALEKFQPPHHLIEYHREQSTKYWIKQAIAKVNDELMLNAINTVTNREKLESESEKLDQGFNRINPPHHSLDNAFVVFEVENTMMRFKKARLRKQWSQKAWFQKFDDGPTKHILKAYSENYLKALDKRVQDLVQAGDLQIWIRCQLETLRKILEGGRFKSQFETATSGGRLNTKSRAKSEYGRIGIPLTMPAPFRLISGYAAREPNGKAPIIKNAERYGPVAVRLKPELKEFALQMLDDALKHSDGKSFLTCRPTFFDRADRRCFPSGRIPFRYKLFFEPNPLKIQGREDLETKIPYQEVQMVRVDKEDIQEVVFCTPKVNTELTQLLEQHGIPYRKSRVKLLRMLVWSLLTSVQLR
jgi:hypothetical protein